VKLVNETSSSFWKHPDPLNYSTAGNFFAGLFNINHLNKIWDIKYFICILLMALKLQTGKFIPSQIKH
jgi:hypothetical protein